ncbi:MAG: DUF5797 family protein [Haloferacaceae archaeon]
MDLTDTERERLADVVRLQPTKNAELGERWGMEDGSEVHAYLESHLGEYYYRDEDSYIRATAEAADLVDVDPGVEEGPEGGPPSVVRVPRLEALVLDVLAGPDDRSQSVVSVLHDLRDHGVDPTVDEVREALRALARKDVVAVEHRAVPTFRRARGTADLTVESMDGEATPAGAGAADDGIGSES